MDQQHLEALYILSAKAIVEQLRPNPKFASKTFKALRKQKITLKFILKWYVHRLRCG